MTPARSTWTCARRHSLPLARLQHLVVHETTRTDKAGNKTVQRRITLRLVDKVRAMRLDDLLEDREESANTPSPLRETLLGPVSTPIRKKPWTRMTTGPVGFA